MSAAPPFTTTSTTIVPPAGGVPPPTPPPAMPTGPTVPIAPVGPVDGWSRGEYGSMIVDTVSAVVIGMPPSEAERLRASAGWVVTIGPFGPTTTMTPDLRWDRLTLYVDNGVVVDVVFD